SEEHTSELQSLTNLVCRLLLEKKKTKRPPATTQRRDTEPPTTHHHTPPNARPTTDNSTNTADHHTSPPSTATHRTRHNLNLPHSVLSLFFCVLAFVLFCPTGGVSFAAFARYQAPVSTGRSLSPKQYSLLLPARQAYSLSFFFFNG